jgi:hypothetical protein
MKRHALIIILISEIFLCINSRMYACDPIGIDMWNAWAYDPNTNTTWYYDLSNDFNSRVYMQAKVIVGEANPSLWEWPITRYLFYPSYYPYPPYPEQNPDNGKFEANLYGMYSYHLSTYKYPGIYDYHVTAYNSSGSISDVNNVKVCIIRNTIDCNEYIGYKTGTDISYTIEPGEGWSYLAAFLCIKNPDGNYAYRYELNDFSGTISWDGMGNYGTYSGQYLDADNYKVGIEIDVVNGRPTLEDYPESPNLKIKEADLDADMDGDGSITRDNDSPDDLLEENPGGYIAVGQREPLDYIINDDLTMYEDRGFIKLEITAGSDKAKLYDSETGGDPNNYKIINLTTQWSQYCTYTPYLQANEVSANPKDIEVTLSYYAPEDTELQNIIHQDKVKLTAFELDKVCLSSPYAINSPVCWNAGDVNVGDPCIKDTNDPNYEQSLIISHYKFMEEGGLLDLDLCFADANFDPSIDLLDFPVSIQEIVKWTEISVPVNSGYFFYDKKLQTNYTAPYLPSPGIDLFGGVYEFEFEFPGLEETRTKVFMHLPLAGADMTSWLENELKGIPAWATSVRNGVEEYYFHSGPLGLPPAPGIYNAKLLAWWIELSKNRFDYIFDPCSADETSPCPIYKLTAKGGGHYTYVTVNGVVVHGVKINNMIWAAFTRAYGWPKGSAYLGSEWNQIWRGWKKWKIEFDTPAASYAVTTGEGKIYDWIKNGAEEPLSDVLRRIDLKLMQEPDDTILKILWPSPDPLDPSKSKMNKPYITAPWPKP